MRRALLVWVGMAGMLFLSVDARAQAWRAIGPPGGDVRTLVAAPNDARLLFLGTTDGHIFGSHDGAAHWQLLGRVGDSHDNVITSILVDARDPSVVFAGTWTLSNRGGAIYRSNDGGHNWSAVALQGQTVRALAQAGSAPDTLFAGTLDGVYRSRDFGRTWDRISPAHHEELQNFDSLAIDPQNPDVIYAGTYHLPWKTTDGGRTWAPIKNGMIDDSDVMSVWIDRQNPAHVLSSACSGIYQSQNGGASWTKIHGIAGQAHRTHLIRLDPQDSQTVYAGTTQGLWRSPNSGATWQRLTPGDWSITAIVIDPKNPQRLVLGTERRGVEVSDDGGRTFLEANEGFNHCQIVDLAVDPQRPERALVVLTNAVEPVLETRNGGATWSPLGPGLDTVHLRHIYAAPGDGFWATLSAGGVVHYEEAKRAWTPVTLAIAETVPCSAGVSPVASSRPKSKTTGKTAAARKASSPCTASGTTLRQGSSSLSSARGKRTASAKTSIAQPVVNDMAFTRDAWFAATEAGLYASSDRGATWSLLRTSTSPKQAFRAVGGFPHSGTIWAVSAMGVGSSNDSGKMWVWGTAPFPQQGDLRLRFADATTLLAATIDGLFISSDAGLSWRQTRLPDMRLRDAAGFGDAIVVASESHGLYFSADRGKSWSRIENPIAEGFFPALVPHNATADAEIVLAASSTEGLYAVELHRGAQISRLNAASSRPAGLPQH